jgi:cytochrome c peroxidase
MRWTFLGSLVIGLAACAADGQGGDGDGDGDGDRGGGATQPRSLLALPLVPPQPAANATSAAKVELGRTLFWDPVLSGDRTVACATCHDPDLAYTDGMRTPIGLPRNTMSLLDIAWNGLTADGVPPRPEDAPMFWDNRAHSLEQQARGPIIAAAEMMGSSFTEATIFPELVTRLSSIPEYATQFSAVFGASGVSEANILAAVAAFERTLNAPESSYDRFVKGDTTALTAQQQRGLAVFTNNGCVNCHSGPMFSDFELHDLRVPGGGGTRFRTASLRGVTLTAPYMHNGAFSSLPEVFGFYRQATQNSPDPQLRGVRAPTGAQAADVISFLLSLSDGEFDRTIPTRVPSGLQPGG